LKELHTRTISGLIFAIVLTGAILLGSYSFGLLFLIISVFALREFYTLSREAGFSPQVYPGLFTGAMVFILSFFIAKQSLPYNAFVYVLPVFYAFPVYELFRKKKNPIANLSLTGFGVIYVSIPFSLLNFVGFHEIGGVIEYHYELLISLFLFVWASDTGGYIFGVSFGRHRLFERISPKKSWEGLIGGVITSIFVAWILTYIFPEYNFSLLGIMALLTALTGTFGDLVESMIKRSIGVKDSGRFMPGHGGLLDRFDSILLAAPMIYFVFQFFL
jgi:phosphatidate cytidylyltransferase